MGVAKTCVRCGLDVAGRPRAKDTSGRYFCEPCWRLKQAPKDSAAQAQQSDATTLDAESDGGVIALIDVTPRQSTPARKQPSEAARGNSGSNSRRPPPGSETAAEGERPIPDYLAEIAKQERRLLWVIVLSMTLGLIPPLLLVLIPVYAVVTFQLARSLGQSPWPWVIGTFLPYAGVVVLIVLNVKATGVLRAAGLTAPLFRSWRWEQ